MNRLRCSFSFVLLAMSSLTAAAQEPTVSGVAFIPRTTISGVVVDIAYDLSSPGGSCAVSARLSTDGGATFPVAIAAASGDIGPGITPGTGKHIRWDAWRDIPHTSAPGAVIQVTADVTLAPAAYATGYRDVVYTDATRANRAVAARIVYPAAASGANVPVGGAAGVRFPVVVFGHGFVVPFEYYGYFWEHVAPRGYIVVMCDTETTISPSHTNYGLDLAFLAAKLQQESANVASPFFGKVAPTAAIMGHSMGGGATILAAQAAPALTTIVTFAAAETNPSAIAAAGSLSLPALLVAGSADCVAPPDVHQVPMYEALASAGKFLMTIENGSHCQFADNSPTCELGEGFVCPDAAFISAPLQQAIVLNLVDHWLDIHLKGQATAWGAFNEAVETYIASDDLAAEGACDPTGIAASPPGLLDTAAPQGLPAPANAFLVAAAVLMAVVAARLLKALRFGTPPPSCP